MDNTSQWLLAGGDILEVKFQRQIKNFTSDFFSANTVVVAK